MKRLGKSRTELYSLVAGLAFAVASLQAAGPDQLVGTWLTAEGKSKVEVAKCGDLYCGSITWMRMPQNDARNEDPSKRSRPLVGVRIVNNFRYDGGATWSGGTLYGPERGKSVDAKLVLVDDDTLEIRVSAGVIKKSIRWTRVR